MGSLNRFKKKLFYVIAGDCANYGVFFI